MTVLKKDGYLGIWASVLVCIEVKQCIVVKAAYSPV